MSAELVRHITGLLAGIGRLQTRPMFGGQGFYCDGVFFGFVLGDGWVGFDADHIDAPEFVALLASYAERSPSGTGVHVIMRGKKPGERCRVGESWDDSGAQV